ncbi:TPA: phosphatase PAP2 family protein [Burkholderia cepacia ATCC 25416]|uniref:phosphatase PAP2 family protein n=1 Tax=Burkholderia cepacia TaxID=292 RepID=UPI0009C05CC5|nr:phosphatase PAP2 family protein [Burkholderia cepacia]HDR9767060.1 phosphatase PAP2 family protein [Burkholderia cepacia ATCC 25416]MCA8075806.1 phosphatase PAP2 family protein [Burkholderia cepacia]RQT75955.1 PAP2 family protein [Burkholderia cepacia]HDR9774165.1 phosphatase PAP2 family protein [Burkholderia cepacia ATCC 25416]HDR9783123.1 phosphatase PAP2 family protein [Burkholderia cepacia ATCC 25416]
MRNRNVAIYGAVWFTIIAVAVVDILWARAIGFSITRGWPFSTISPRIGISLIAVAALTLLSYVPRYRGAAKLLRCREVAAAIFFLISLNFWAQAISVISYLGTALNRPAIEDGLVKFDTAIGFDWMSVYQWFSGHPMLAATLEYAYFSPFAQIIALSFVLAIVRRIDDLSELMMIVVVSLLLVMLISIPFPASSAFLHYGITGPKGDWTVHDFVLLRSGALKSINPLAAQGLVSMPSYHVMMAIFLVYTARNLRFAFPVAIALNMAVIASTITVGGHYLADVLAGALCAAAAILAVRLGLRSRASARGSVGWPSSAADTGG